LRVEKYFITQIYIISMGRRHSKQTKRWRGGTTPVENSHVSLTKPDGSQTDGIKQSKTRKTISKKYETLEECKEDIKILHNRHINLKKWVRSEKIQNQSKLIERQAKLIEDQAELVEEQAKRIEEQAERIERQSKQIKEQKKFFALKSKIKL
jgi:hypothetical protein